MLKKLDKLVIKAFIGPFIATFFITLLVLVMQFFWLYIDDFVGKGLGLGVIFEFIWYQTATLVPLALPLAVLISSLMSFGNLGESYELVAVKSSGISLLRFIRPVLVVTIFISGIAFMFANYVIPIANLKAKTLLSDIVFSRPSFDLKEGVFYDKINGFAIKIGEKEKNDSIIRDIIIYEQNNNVQDNFIIASDGVMRVSNDKRFLEFYLRNGWRYEEKANAATNEQEFIRLGFREYKKSFDLSTFGFRQRTADSLNKGDTRMLSMRQLSVAMDSIKRSNRVFGDRVYSEVLSQINAVTFLDSNWQSKPVKINVPTLDSIIPDSVKGFIQPRLNTKVAGMRTNNDILHLQFSDRLGSLRNHEIEWHRKLTLSFACIVFLFIGAPLGSIIRKGGLGMPLIVSIAFFMVFYFTGSTGEKFGRSGDWNPAIGMWFSTLVLVPVGTIITYKALKDSQLFNKEFYQRFLSKISIRKRRRHNT